MSDAPRRPRPSPLGALTAGLNAVGTALIFAILVLVNTDIGGRALFDRPVDGVPEMVELAYVALVFLQLPHALRLGRLTTADSLFARFAAACPRGASALSALYNLTGMALFAAIVYATWPGFANAWTRNLFIGTEGAFTAPTWPTKLVIVFGAGVMAVQFLALAVGNARRALGRAAPAS